MNSMQESEDDDACSALHLELTKCRSDYSSLRMSEGAEKLGISSHGALSLLKEPSAVVEKDSSRNPHHPSHHTWSLCGAVPSAFALWSRGMKMLGIVNACSRMVSLLFSVLKRTPSTLNAGWRSLLVMVWTILPTASHQHQKNPCHTFANKIMGSLIFWLIKLWECVCSYEDSGKHTAM